MRRDAVLALTLAAAGVAAWPEPAAADDDDDDAEGGGKVLEVIEELFLGEVVYPQDALELQLTAGLSAARAGGRTGLGAGLEVELGLTDRLQLAARAELVRAPGGGPGGEGAATGLGSPSVEVLYNPLSDRARGLAISAGLEVAFPALSDAGEAAGGAGDAWEIEAFAVAYRVFGPVHANLAVGLELELGEGDGAGDGEERELAAAAALGVFAPIGRWAPVLELRVDGGAEGAAPVAQLSAGVLWHPGAELELGAAVQVGLDERSVGGLVLATVELELGDP